MIYKGHGITLQIALNKALKELGIEMTSYVAPYAITTDTICIIDTTKHDEEIRADEIREFSKAIKEYVGNHRYGTDDLLQFIAEYEKEANKMQVPKKLYFEGDGYAQDGSMVYDFAKCQICGHEFEEGYAEWGCNYCPNCGNKLDWEGNA